MEKRNNPEKGLEDGSNLEVLKKLLSLKQEKREMPLAEALKDLPEKIQENVLMMIERLRGYGSLSEDDIRNEVFIRIKEVRDSYVDRRFDCINQSYLRLEMTRLIDQMAEEVVEKKKNKSFVTISFDVNGLKSVNDLNGHEKGDQYLKKMVAILKDGKTTVELKQLGLDVLFASCGGDEFSIVISGDFSNLTDDNLDSFEKVRIAYQTEIGNLDFADVLDFNDSAVREKFSGIEIPKDFSFVGSVSIGFSDLSLILKYFKVDENKSYQENLQLLMGLMIDTADKESKADKDRYKKYLAESDDEKENFLAMVLRRTEESMLMQEEIINLKRRNRELEEKLAGLEK